MNQGEHSLVAIRHIEVALASSLSPSVKEGIETRLVSWINSESQSDRFSLGKNGEIDNALLPDQFLFPHVDQIVKVRIVDDAIDTGYSSAQSIPIGCTFVVHLFELSREEISVEEIEPSGGGDEWTTGCDSLPLPHVSFDGLWENLIFDSKVKLQLLEYSQSAMLFSDRNVSEHIVHWNRILLLHG